MLAPVLLQVYYFSGKTAYAHDQLDFGKTIRSFNIQRNLCNVAISYETEMAKTNM